MKCFLLGLLGAVLGFCCMLVVYSQYSDYRAAAQSYGWLAEVEPAQRAVEANAVRLGATSGAGLGVAKPRFTDQAPEHFEVTPDGIILMQGGLSGQMIVLVPSLGPDGVEWRCLGGSKADVRGCKNDGTAGSTVPAVVAGAPPATRTATDASGSPCRISDQGIGALRLGMTLAAAQQAMPRARFTRSSDGEGVALVDVALDESSVAIAYAGEDNADSAVDMARTIENLETFTPACTTAEGIHPESTVEEAAAAYGPVSIIRRSELESREYIRFERQPSGLQIRLDGGGEFPDGVAETTRYTPGAKILSIAVVGQ